MNYFLIHYKNMKQQFLELIDRKIDKWNWDEKQLCRQIRLEVEKIEDESIPLKLALDFAFWYHNWLLNRERKSVEEEFQKYIIVKYASP